MSVRPPTPGDVPDEGSAPQTLVSPRPSASDAASADQVGEAGEETKPSGDKKTGSFWKELPVLIVMALVLALLIKTFLVQAFYIPSESMVPTLEPGDRVLVNKVVYRFHPPGRGDVIVFENPDPASEPHRNLIAGVLNWVGRGLGFAQPADEDFIKRVIGLPGETIEGRGGSVYINGQKLEEPYLNGVTTGSFGPKKVPEGAYFVMGDNRGNSNDSRYGLGTIPEDKIVGEAFVIIWPPSRWGGL